MTAIVDATVRSEQRATRALTLIELLVVMTVVATLMGIGIGTFRSLVRSERVAAAQVQDAFLGARMFARRERAPAAVVVDPANNQVYATGLQAVGNWHFEDEAGTGWPGAAQYLPESLDQHGAIGWGLKLADGQALLLSDLPSRFDSPHGFGVDVHLWPERDPRPLTLLERPGSWRLLLDTEDRLVVVLQLQRLTGSETEEVRVVVGAPVRWPYRFAHLSVVFDGRSLYASLDGARLASDTRFGTTRRLGIRERAPVHTGSGPLRYRGRLDELRLMSVVVGRHDPLPQDVELEGERRELRLDAQGRLDAAWHATPELVVFRHGDPPNRMFVEFGLLGTVRSWEQTP